MGNIPSNPIPNTAVATNTASVVATVASSALTDESVRASTNRVTSLVQDVKNVTVKGCLEINQDSFSVQAVKLQGSLKSNLKNVMNQSVTNTVAQVASALSKNASSGDSSSARNHVRIATDSTITILTDLTESCEANTSTTMIQTVDRASATNMIVNQVSEAVATVLVSCVADFMTQNTATQRDDNKVGQEAKARAIGASSTAWLQTLEMVFLVVVALCILSVVATVAGLFSAISAPLVLFLVYMYTGGMAYDKATGVTGLHDPFDARTVKDCDENAKAYSEPSKTIVNGPFCFCKPWAVATAPERLRLTGFVHRGTPTPCTASEIEATLRRLAAEDTSVVAASWYRDTQYEDYLRAVSTTATFGGWPSSSECGAGQTPTNFSTMKNAFSFLQTREIQDHDINAPGMLYAFALDESAPATSYAFTAHDSYTGVKSRSEGLRVVPSIGELVGASATEARRVQSLADPGVGIVGMPYPISADIEGLSEQSVNVYIRGSGGWAPPSISDSAAAKGAAAAVDAITLPQLCVPRSMFSEACRDGSTWEGIVVEVRGTAASDPQAGTCWWDRDDSPDKTLGETIVADNVCFARANHLMVPDPDAAFLGHASPSDAGAAIRAEYQRKTCSAIPQWIYASDVAVGPVKCTPTAVANTALLFLTPDRRTTGPVGSSPGSALTYEEAMQARADICRQTVTKYMATYVVLLAMHFVLLRISRNGMLSLSGLVFVLALGGFGAEFRELYGAGYIAL